MSNRKNKYKRNHNGISIRPDYGRINISKRVIELLEYPEFIHFEKYNDTYLALTVGSLNDENSYKVKMQNGWNYLKVISTTQSDAKDTSIWKYEYKIEL